MSLRNAGKHDLWCYAPSLVLILLSLPALVMPDDTRMQLALSHSGGLMTLLTYHFVHANIWHLLCNTTTLLLFRPRRDTILVAYVCAVLSALPLMLLPTATPTGGLSALIFACLARRCASWHEKVWRIVIPNLLFILVPGIDWRLHLISFFISYALWKIYASYRERRA